jgi:hypothetical protein
MHFPLSPPRREATGVCLELIVPSKVQRSVLAKAGMVSMFPCTINLNAKYLEFGTGNP